MAAFDRQRERAAVCSARAARRRRYLRRRRAVCLVLLAMCGAGLAVIARSTAAFLTQAGTPPPSTVPATGAYEAAPRPGQGAWNADTTAALMLLAESIPEVDAMLRQPERWPQELAALLAHNQETLDFVLAYPDRKDAEPPDTVGDLEPGTCPLLLQWDERWGCVPYAGSILAVSGCGPTALAMVACGLTGDDTLTPARIARWAQDNGYAGEVGTSWELMRSGCGEFGLQAQELTLDRGTVFEALQSGRPIICSMRPGDFTTTGHFIVLTGVQDGKLRLLDPNSPRRSAELWEYDRLEYQIKNLWAYSPKTE
ncbi:C39 family peptidase [Allofournierella sp.]|uniref:C39 family peptidase n=1 Tax=Allofournierella sp. TaxID=1940256 RepID=UPI003AB1D2F5